MAKRYQTTFTFSKPEAAKCFTNWLISNTNDRDYGHPRYIGERRVGPFEWLVEYSAESDLARGVATGIDLAIR